MGETKEKMKNVVYEERLLETLIHLLQKKQKGYQLTEQEKLLWDGLRDYGIR